MNLGWKLAFAARTEDHDELLDSYDRERRLVVEGCPGGPGPRPGKRMPDQVVVSRGRRVRLHDLTACPGLHLLLQRDAAAIPGRFLGRRVVAHRIDSWPGCGLTAVRPDGHVGFRCRESDPDLLADWLELVAARSQ